jgi:hypothetical protein
VSAWWEISGISAIFGKGIIVGFLASRRSAKASASRKNSQTTQNKSTRRNPSSKMKTANEYKEGVSSAVAFKHEYPNEKATTAARIHYVNATTVRSNLQREQLYSGKEVQHKGHNKVLLDIQVEALYKYVDDLYLSGYGATKAMVFAAIGCLKANQLPAKEPPSWRWFQIFIKEHPNLL